MLTLEEGGRFAISVWIRLGSRIGTQESTGDSVLSGIYKLQRYCSSIAGIFIYITTFKKFRALTTGSRSTFEFPSRVNLSGPSLHCT